MTAESLDSLYGRTKGLHGKGNLSNQKIIPTQALR